MAKKRGKGRKRPRATRYYPKGPKSPKSTHPNCPKCEAKMYPIRHVPTSGKARSVYICGQCGSPKYGIPKGWTLP